MIQGKWFAPGEDLAAEVLPVRREVFGVSGSPTDPEGWNTLVYLDGQPAASGRIWCKVIVRLPILVAPAVGPGARLLRIFPYQLHS